MTALLLHGIAAASAPEPLSAPQHLRIRIGELVALATPAPPALIEGSDEPPLAEATSHHALLSAYAAQTTVRPVRFGSVFSGEAALVDALWAEEASHLDWLRRMGNRVEYVMKVAADPDVTDAVASTDADTGEDGRAYLQRKRTIRDGRRTLSVRRSAFAAEIPQRLKILGADSIPIVPTASDTLASHALSLPRGATQDVIGSARSLAKEASALGLKLILQGPGPLYGWADDNGAIHETKEQVDA